MFLLKGVVVPDMGGYEAGVIESRSAEDGTMMVRSIVEMTSA